MTTPPRHTAPIALQALATILAALAMIGPFTIDTYLPSFPHIGAEFSATPAQLQQTLSFYLFTMAFMTLFHGTLSDSFGRRPVILVSLAVYAFASIGCALSASSNDHVRPAYALTGTRSLNSRTQAGTSLR